MTINKFLQAVLSALAFIAAYLLLVWMVVQDIKIAATIVLSSVGTVALIAVGWGMSHASHSQTARQPDVITGSAYKVIPPPVEPLRLAAPTPGVPAPRYIDVPRYFEMGSPVPLGARVVLRTPTDDGSQVEVPQEYLARFLALPTPRRSEWTGKKEMYSLCVEFCETHGLIVRTSEGGCRWDERYPIESRLNWSDQFKSTMTR